MLYINAFGDEYVSTHFGKDAWLNMKVLLTCNVSLRDLFPQDRLDHFQKPPVPFSD